MKPVCLPSKFWSSLAQIWYLVWFLCWYFWIHAVIAFSREEDGASIPTVTLGSRSGWNNKDRNLDCHFWISFLVKMMNLKGGPMFACKWWKTDPRKMLFKSAWKLSVVLAKKADQIISRVFGPIISTISKWPKMDTWRSDIFFRRCSRNLEMDTWRSGCFWFNSIQNFRT